MVVVKGLTCLANLCARNRSRVARYTFVTAVGRRFNPRFLMSSVRVWAICQHPPLDQSTVFDVQRPSMGDMSTSATRPR
jgi:hypothetical protein